MSSVFSKNMQIFADILKIYTFNCIIFITLFKKALKKPFSNNGKINIYKYYT